MKNTFLQLLILLVTFGTISSSCKKQHTVVPKPVPTSTLTDSIEFNFFNAVQHFTFNGAAGGDFVTASGVQFHVPYFSFREEDGDTVFGNIDADVVEILTPANMIFMNRPATASTAPLNTGGLLRVNFTVNDNPVYMSDTLVYIKVPTDISLTTLKVYDGTEDATKFVDWTQKLNEDENPISVGIETITNNGLMQDYYTFQIDTFSSNWVGIHQPLSQNGGTAGFNLDLPKQYNNTNTYCFVRFNNQQAVLPGYFDGNQFVTPKTIPVGANVTVIIMSEIDGNYYSKFISNITVSQSNQLTVSPDPTTYSDLNNSVLNI